MTEKWDVCETCKGEGWLNELAARNQICPDCLSDGKVLRFSPGPGDRGYFESIDKGRLADRVIADLLRRARYEGREDA